MVARLSVMMFLQYWPLGLWAVTLCTYLAANTGDQGTGTYSPGFIGYSATAGAIGSLLSPVVMGALSDRYFSANRLVLLTHIGCGVSVLWMAVCTTQIGFFLGLLAYFQFFVPGVTLTNTVSLRHLQDPDREFTFVRSFGTVSWIAAGLFIGFLWPWLMGSSIEATRIPLWISVVSHAGMVLYSLTLPHTPPEQTSGSFGWTSLTGGRTLWSNRPFVFFLAFSLLATLPSMAYTSYGNLFLNEQGYSGAAGKLTLGQASEVFCMLIVPFVIRYVGLKWLLVGGVLAWGIRYAMLAAGAAWQLSLPVYVAIVIHGPCYVFIYVTGQLYIDQLADDKTRGAAQGWHALATTGLGHLFGALLCGVLQENYLTPQGVAEPPYHWVPFWLIPAAICFVTALLFQLTFRDPGKGARRPIELHAEDLPPSPLDALAEPPPRSTRAEP